MKTKREASKNERGSTHRQNRKVAPRGEFAAPPIHRERSATEGEEAERKAKRAEWRSAVDLMRNRYLTSDEVTRVINKLHDTLIFLTGVPACIQEKETVDDRARRYVAMDAKVALRGLLKRTLYHLLEAVEFAEGGVDKQCAEIVVDVLLESLNRMRGLYTHTKKRHVFECLAKSQVEFPSVFSLFQKENSKLETTILTDLKLGENSPFSPDPRKTYTPYALLAMAIVQWIDFERQHRWWPNYEWHSESIYRKIDPDLNGKPFCDIYLNSWERVIGFHLDFFQAPPETRKKTATEHPSLRAEHEEWEAKIERASTNQKDASGNVISWGEWGWRTALCPWAEITRIPAFQEMLRLGRDKKAATEGSLYNRVKSKVLEAVGTLAKKRKGSIAPESVPNSAKP